MRAIIIGQSHKINQNDMLFPDETYEDYKKRTKTTPNPNSTQPTATLSKGCLQIVVQQSDCVAQPGHKSLTKLNQTPNSSGRESAASNSSSGGRRRTIEFFENIPKAAQTDAQTTTKNSKTQDKAFQAKRNDNRNYEKDKLLQQPTTAEARNLNDDLAAEDLSTNPVFLRTCEALMQQYRIRPDFFCQYYKAVR